MKSEDTVAAQCFSPQIYFLFNTVKKKMCEGCVSAVITVCQQSTGVCYQQVCFIDRCVSLRLLCFIGSGETGMLVSFPLISIIKTAPANKRSQASLFISELSALLVWTYATPVISPRSYNSVCWFLFWAFKWHFGGSPASGYICLFTASRFLRAQLLKTAQGGLVSYMNLCLCFGRLKSILCYIFSSTFLFSAFFILVFWHKSWVTSLLYVRDQRSFESWKHFSFCCYTTLCINNLVPGVLSYLHSADIWPAADWPRPTPDWPHHSPRTPCCTGVPRDAAPPDSRTERSGYLKTACPPRGTDPLTNQQTGCR